MWRDAPLTDSDVKKLATSTALPVLPERVAVCSPAGLTHPEDWLPDDKRRRFLDWEDRVDPALATVIPPIGCHTAPADREHEMQTLLVESGMAVLVEEDAIPRDVANRLLKGGLFAVAHKEFTERLTFDRRPMNSLEKRLNWVVLPLGIFVGPHAADRETTLRHTSTA